MLLIGDGLAKRDGERARERDVQGHDGGEDKVDPEHRRPAEREENGHWRTVRGQLGSSSTKASSRLLTSSLMIINGAMLVILDDPPNGDSHRSKEGSGDIGMGINRQPPQPLHEAGPNLRRRRIDIDITPTGVPAEPDGEHHPKEGDALVRGGEDPGLEDAAGGGLAGGPGPDPFV